MDQTTRNKLRSVVTHCRRALEDSVAQELQGRFGIFVVGKGDSVEVEDEARLGHLSDDERVYRRDLIDHYEHVRATGAKPKDALVQLIREVAFTHLNRLCAYRMMEARGLIREAVSKGLKSQGFLFYLADNDEDERRYESGQQDVAYRNFLDWLGGTLSQEIGVLFSPTDPANQLYPAQKVLDEVLEQLNDGSLAAIWTEDEAIGWVYQYFTPKELRDRARKESQAPRNSYELAFRNQFFTPRYVVEFLTDNTLGRIWYEMRNGDTKLKDQCRYMVRRPTEVFLKDGEQPPKDAAEVTDDLRQEELLKLPMYVSHRGKKDPRELKILDPACGSGHFLLYCFDLLLTIYEEAYADPDLSPALRRDYPTLDALRRDVPRLILANNLHGIDIDLRATQIAALALWLRCQRAYQDMGLKKDRPKITRSNFVCAEAMPGEQSMLMEFVGQLEPRLLGQLVEVVFDKMKLAGEAGSLLKIEEEIRDAVAGARRQWLSGPISIQRSLFDDDKPVVQQQQFDFSGITDAQFFEQAEAKVVDALRSYAEKAQNGERLQRRLFTEDAVRGFAFVDLCHKRFDVLLMNPPFGLGVKKHYSCMRSLYPDGYVDMYSCFLSRAAELCIGRIGAISSRSFLLTKKLVRLRRSLIIPRLAMLLDLGWAVMDAATVQSCAYVIEMGAIGPLFIALDRKEAVEKSAAITGSPSEQWFAMERVTAMGLPQSRLLYMLPGSVIQLLQSAKTVGKHVLIAKQGMKTFNDFRFLRLRFEVSPNTIGEQAIWEPLSKGGPYATFYADLPLLVRWQRSGDQIADENKRVNGQTAQARQASIYYRRAGATYSRRSSKDFGVRILPAGCIIGEKGPAILPQSNYSPEFVIGLLNSRLLNSLVHLQANAKQYDTGILEGLPWSDPLPEHVRIIEGRVKGCVARIRSLASHDETSSIFAFIPAGESLSAIEESWNSEKRLASAFIDESTWLIDATVDTFYAADSEPLRGMLRSPSSDENDTDDEEASESNDGDEDNEGAICSAVSQMETAKTFVSIVLGCIFGRWDTRSVFGQCDVTLPPVIEKTPSCPPAMLQDVTGYPAASQPASYPHKIDWDGVIVDDPDQADDIVRRVRDILEVVWRDRAEAIEKEACEFLGTEELRDYFRRPGKGGLWDDHVSRYSKSRRKAPIYWLLQSSKKNYSLWLYYHRLDKDLLFKALVNYVEPKIRLEDSRLEALRTQKASAGGTGRDAKRLGKDIERQEEFLSELRDFEDKLRRVAELHLEPDLNDGVVLNIAPLRELVPWKEAKGYWDELLDGQYEWSSIGRQLREKGLVK